MIEVMAWMAVADNLDEYETEEEEDEDGNNSL